MSVCADTRPVSLPPGLVVQGRAGLLLLVLAVLVCHGVLGSAHQSSSYQWADAAAQVSAHGQSPADGGHSGGGPVPVDHGVEGSYYAALLLLGLSGLVAVSLLGRAPVRYRRIGTSPVTRWYVEPRLRPPSAPNLARLQVFRL